MLLTSVKREILIENLDTDGAEWIDLGEPFEGGLDAGDKDGVGKAIDRAIERWNDSIPAAPERRKKSGGDDARWPSRCWILLPRLEIEEIAIRLLGHLRSDLVNRFQDPSLEDVPQFLFSGDRRSLNVGLWELGEHSNLVKELTPNIFRLELTPSSDPLIRWLTGDDFQLTAALLQLLGDAETPKDEHELEALGQAVRTLAEQLEQASHQTYAIR